MISDEKYIQWTGGAGFYITYDGIRIGLDLYLSNSCMDPEGNFKRLTPPPTEPSNIVLDYLIASHAHGDHLDTGCLSEWFDKNKELKLIGPASSLLAATDMVPPDRKILLDRGGCVDLAPHVKIRGVYCDHGNQSLDAIGVVLELGNSTIYFTGDTCYRPDLRELTGAFDVDILIVPINPAFGNPGSEGAAKITRMYMPKTVIPCHYWLFMEHGGDPASFADECAKTAPETNCAILAIGEKIKF